MVKPTRHSEEVNKMKKLMSVFLAVFLAFSLVACGEPPQQSVEKEIYNGNGIRVVAQRLDYNSSFFGPELVLLIDNQSSRPITVQCRDASINGYMVDTIMSQDVSSGKRAIGTLTILNSSLDEIGVSRIEEFDFSLHIFDGDTWRTIVDTNPIHLTF